MGICQSTQDRQYPYKESSANNNNYKRQKRQNSDQNYIQMNSMRSSTAISNINYRNTSISNMNNNQYYNDNMYNQQQIQQNQVYQMDDKSVQNYNPNNRNSQMHLSRNSSFVVEYQGQNNHSNLYQNTFDGNIYDLKGDNLIENNSSYHQQSDFNSNKNMVNDQQCMDIGNQIAVNSHIVNMEFEIANFDTKVFEEADKPYKLQLYCKSYQTENGNRIIVFKGEYIVPVNINKIAEYLYNKDLTMNMNKKILEYDQKFLENSHTQTKNIEKIDSTEIVYKKIQQTMLTLPRDFCYIRKVKCLEPRNKIFTEAWKSVNHVQYPVNEENVRGNIKQYGITYIPAELVYGDEFKGKCLVRFCQEIDYSANHQLKLMRTSLASEIKNNIERFYEYFQQESLINQQL